MFAWADIRMPIVSGRRSGARRHARLWIRARRTRSRTRATTSRMRRTRSISAGEWYLDRKHAHRVLLARGGRKHGGGTGDRSGAGATGAARGQAGSGRIRAQRRLPRAGVRARRLEHGSEGLRRYAGGDAGAGRHRGHRRGGLQNGTLHRGAFGRLRRSLSGADRKRNQVLAMRTVRPGRRRRQDRRAVHAPDDADYRTTRT